MTEPVKTRRFNGRGFTSLLLTVSFLVVIVTGIILYVTPKGRVAHWTNWTLFGLGKEQWSAIHMVNSLLFVIVSIVHLYLNWGVLWRYIKKKTSGVRLRESVAALVVTAVVCVGTFYQIPPFGWIVSVNDGIKAYWALRAVRAPVPHAEDFSLERFADEIDLPVQDAIDALRKEEFDVQNAQIKIKELGEQRGIPPNEVYEAILKHHPEAGARRRGEGRGRGLGRRRGGEPPGS